MALFWGAPQKTKIDRSYQEPGDGMMARVGGAWEWHQDFGYWYAHFLYPDLASCMIAIDRATRQNGCLQVLRGSHRMGRIDHGQTGTQTGADVERVEAALLEMELVHCELQPGDVLFFHYCLVHGSMSNQTKEPRKAVHVRMFSGRDCCENANQPIENLVLRGWNFHSEVRSSASANA